MKVLITDDSPTYRKILKTIVAKNKSVTEIELAVDGQDCMNKIASFQPDVVTLDIDMPAIDGLEVLQQLAKIKAKCLVIVVTCKSADGMNDTLGAMELGAFDFVAKPLERNPEAGFEVLQNRLTHVLEAAHFRLEAQKEYHKKGTSPEALALKNVEQRKKASLVAFGISTGGPAALTQIIPYLPANLAVPVVIVQHMPDGYTPVLARSLSAKSLVPVREVTHGEPIFPGRVYLAPTGKHLKISKNDAGKPVFQLDDNPPVSHCKPSIDVLFQSLAENFGENASAFIMTGMGVDGIDGLRAIKKAGGFVFAQDEESCAVFGTALQAIHAHLVDKVVPLNKIAECVRQFRMP